MSLSNSKSSLSKAIQLSSEEIIRLKSKVLQKAICLIHEGADRKFGSNEKHENYDLLRSTIKLHLDLLLIKKGKQWFLSHYNQIEVDRNEILETFTPSNRALRSLLYDTNKPDNTSLTKKTYLVEGFYLFAYDMFRSEYMSEVSNSGISIQYGLSHIKDDHTDQELETMIIQYLDPEYLHFIGLYLNLPKNDQQEKEYLPWISGNNLNHPQVGKFLIGIDAERKAVIFRHIGAVIQNNVLELNSKLESSLRQGNLIRIVFDVEQGGILYYRIMTNVYLIVGNLNQGAMNQCESQVQKLYRSIMEYLGYGFG